MSFPPVNPEPIDPLEVEAASGSVLRVRGWVCLSGHRNWGGGVSRPDVVLLGLIALLVLVVVALVVL